MVYKIDHLDAVEIKPKELPQENTNSTQQPKELIDYKFNFLLGDDNFPPIKHQYISLNLRTVHFYGYSLSPNSVQKSFSDE